MGSRKEKINTIQRRYRSNKISVDHTLISFFLLLKIRTDYAIDYCHLTTKTTQMHRRDSDVKGWQTQSVNQYIR